MTKDKQRLYIASAITAATLLMSCALRTGARYACAGLILILVPLCFVLVPKRKSFSVRKREILMLTTVISVLFVLLIQMSGMFFEFYKNPYFINTRSLFTDLLPMAVIIVGSELIRSVLANQNNKFASLVAFVACLLAEILMFNDFYAITTLNRFMDLVGMTLLPAITGGIFYHRATKNYGAGVSISYRLITTLYIYLVPMISGISDALVSCIKIFLPIALLALISSMYDKKPTRAVQKKGDVSSKVSLAAILICAVGVAMLISCQFRFGALVIATESMTGEINKGDMIIYEQYDDQNIKEGQVIVFSSDKNNKIVHRVIKIETIGGETRYYTKGDANNTPDSGYRTESDIVGLTDIKVPYIGYPSLWLREIITN